MSSDRAAAIIQKYDTALTGLEDAVLARVEAALEESYRLLERRLLEAYSGNQGLSLMARQRSLLILAEVNEYLALINTRQAETIQTDFEALLRATDEQGQRMAADLVQAIGNETLDSFVAVPIEAVRMASENAVKRLKRYDDEFRDRATGIINLGLIQGWGTQRVAMTLRQQLGVTKAKAEMIARTETIQAHDEATRANYQRHRIELVQRIATQDNRVCGWCAARAGNVYPIASAPVAIHPNDRCYSTPYKQAWLEAGLIDVAWLQRHQQDCLAKSEDEPKYGVAPFERSAGLTQPPRPIWTPTTLGNANGNTPG
jgi:SPP1 gp7 family putative phage head morphogenesis protein